MFAGSARSGGKLLLAVLGATFAAFSLVLVAVIGLVSSTAPSDAPALGRVALWLPLVHDAAAPFGLPDALELGLISRESGGNYLSTLDDTNGTTDAGLGQINSGPHPANLHWVAFGLLPNPYDPTRNVAASVQILAADIRGNGGDVSSGLYAYNGGTAADGERYAPGYAPAVLAAAQALDTTAELALWPVAGHEVAHGGDTWLAPASAGSGLAYIIVAASAPVGDPLLFGGRAWTPLAAPSRLTATVAGAAVTVRSSFEAPGDLQALMPSGAAYWWLVAPISASPIPVSIQAAWAPGPRPLGRAGGGLYAGAAITLQEEP